MALSSDCRAKSVVALSESPLFHYQYSSICDAIAHLSKDALSLAKVQDVIQALCLPYVKKQAVTHFQTDGVNLFRQHSPCLEGRHYVYKANNVIPGNKPLGIGYSYSFVNWADLPHSWSLPFGVNRVGATDHVVSMGARQITQIAQSDAFKETLVVNTCDSSYGCARYLSPTQGVANLVSLTRLRYGKKVYCKAASEPTGGAPAIYGAVAYLTQSTRIQTSLVKGKIYTKEQVCLYDGEPCAYLQLEETTNRGKKLRIELRRYSSCLMRSKPGFSMKETVFDVVAVKVLDAQTGQRFFGHDLFIGVCGQCRSSLSLLAVFKSYRHRFDLEVSNRFQKQCLLLDSFQTPVVSHLDNWVLVVGLAMWLLYISSGEVDACAKKWQKYSDKVVGEGGLKTASQTRKGAERLFCGFDSKPFLPGKYQKGLGRKKGATQVRRPRYLVVKKGRKVPKRE